MTAPTHPAAGPPALTGRAYAVLFALLIAATILPFLVASLPVMVDLFGHIGRYAVMLRGDQSPWLSAYYDFEWRLVGNLGADLLARMIGPWIGAERAGILIAAFIPVIGIAGIAGVSRALHGRIQPSALLAAIFVLGSPFHFGFVNYELGTGLALLTFAAWITLRDGPIVRLLLIVGPLVFMTWVAHAMGWAILSLLIAGFELERWRRDPSWRTVGGSIPPGLALLPPLILTLLWNSNSGAALGQYYDQLIMRKLMGWVTMLRGGSPVIDIGTPIVIALTIAIAWWRGAIRVDWRLGLGGVLLTLFCLGMPTMVLGSWGADDRLAPVAVMVVLVSLRSTGRPRDGRVVAAIAVALFLLRCGEMGIRWQREGARYQAALTALDFVPKGARIHAVALVNACHVGWTTRGWAHLPDLAIGRRDALVNSQWRIEGAPLLRVRYPLPPEISNDPSQQIPAWGCGKPELTALHRRIAILPPGRIDYLWVLDRHGLGPLWPGHRPIYATYDTALYRVAP